MMFPKPKREVDLEYLKWVRKLKCLACSIPAVEAHHVDSRGSGGSDFTAVPLCRMHHIEIHLTGATKFSERYALNLPVIIFKMRDRYNSRPKK